ncbi:MAG: hypothetical protein PHX51_08580 [Clostridia bacterium]|nr:hypothetical protein [Clostridia bacterium]
MNKYFLYDGTEDTFQFFKTKEDYDTAVAALAKNISDCDGLPEEHQVYNTFGGEIIHQAVVVPTAFKKDVCTCILNELFPTQSGECNWSYDHDFNYVGEVKLLSVEAAAEQRKENRKNHVEEISEKFEE